LHLGKIHGNTGLAARFTKNYSKMQTEFQFILDKLRELLAVETLEFHNKNLLSGNDATRSEYKQEELKSLINRVNVLALDVAGNRPVFKTMDGDANGCDMQSFKMRQG